MVLNGPERIPIGAIVENPDSLAFAEFSIARQDDGSVQLERKNPDGLNISKRFSFPPATGKKDNFVVMMDVDFRNDGAQPYNNGGYFVTLGSTRPIHPTDMPSYTRLAWFAGDPEGIDVTWFPEQNYPLVGVQKRRGAKLLSRKGQQRRLGWHDQHLLRHANYAAQRQDRRAVGAAVRNQASRWPIIARHGRRDGPAGSPGSAWPDGFDAFPNLRGPKTLCAASQNSSTTKPRS